MEETLSRGRYWEYLLFFSQRRDLSAVVGEFLLLQKFSDLMQLQKPVQHTSRLLQHPGIVVEACKRAGCPEQGTEDGVFSIYPVLHESV